MINMQNIISGGGRQRIIGLDLLRCCAIFFVIAGHFFSLNTEFRTSEFSGVSIFIQGIFFSLFSSGVPLFIMLTGYLNKNKTVTKEYYKSGIRVIVSYVFFSIITILFRKYYLHEGLSWAEWGLKILDFSAIPYGWYIEMWIGLFLMTPFLNMLYKAIPTQWQKKILILTLYILTALPDLFNRYNVHLVPGFWSQCFPLTLFFIGTYISEYKPILNIWKLLCCILVLCLINPVATLAYEFFYGPHTMIHIAGGSWGVFGTIIAVSLFVLLYQIDIKHSVIRKILTNISLLSLDMYLCCYIFDALTYPYFIKHFFIDQNQFGIWFFVIVPILFGVTFIAALAKDTVFKGIHKIFSYCSSN